MNVALVYKNLKAENCNISHVGLGVSAQNVAQCLQSHGITAQVKAVIDGYDLQQWLNTVQVTHVALQAPWMDTPFVYGLCRKFPHIQFALICHSNVGFLQADAWAVKIIREGLKLQEQVTNFHVAGNSQKFCNWVKAAYELRCLCLPNLYYLSNPLPDKPLYHQGTLKLGIFGAIRVQKNIMTAAAAALVIHRTVQARRTEIWLSSGREEGGQGVVAAVRQMIHDLPDVALIESGWLEWEAFRQIVSRMHLLLQPSYTESFNIVTADGIAMGTPSVVSTAIDWVPKHWQACADTAIDIARVGRYLLRDPFAAKEGYTALQNHNTHAIEAWKGFLR